MGNKHVTTIPMFADNTDGKSTDRKECGICFSKLGSIGNNQRCMTCGTIGCKMCIQTTAADPQTDTFTVICTQCNQKKQKKSASFMSDNLMKIVVNHKHNGRELLVYGYIKVLWVSHCLLYDFDYTSRFPSSDVVQCIISWLYIQESFDKTNIDKSIKLSNANQYIERICADNKFMSHIFGTSSIRSPGCKTWKFELLGFEKLQPNFVIGVAIENKINEIRTLTNTTFNENSKFGYGITWTTLSHSWPYFHLKINDIIVMKLDFGRNAIPYEETNQLFMESEEMNNYSYNKEQQDGVLEYRVYRDGKCISETYSYGWQIPNYDVNSKYGYKLAVAMHQNDKLTLLEEWW